MKRPIISTRANGAAPPDFGATMLTITPPMAKGYLQHTAQPRVQLKSGFFEGRMLSYYRAMVRGDWVFNRADPIAFNTAGALVNGRHRMEALSRCPDDMALPFAVIYHATDAEVRMMDRAKPRTLADALQVDRNLAAVGGFVWDVCHHGLATPSDVEMRPYIERVQEPLDAMEALIGKSRTRLWSSAAVVSAPVVIGLEHGTDSHHFVHAVTQLGYLARGEFRSINNASLALHNQFASATGLRLSKIDVFARTLVAMDPERANITKITIKDRDIYLQRLRAVFKVQSQTVKEMRAMDAMENIGAVRNERRPVSARPFKESKTPARRPMA